MRLFPYWPPGSSEYGWATLDGTPDSIVGICCKDDNVRRLAIELQYSAAPPNPVVGATRAPEVFFEVRPDLPYSLFGARVWQALQGNRIPYEQLRRLVPVFGRVGRFGIELPVQFRAALPRKLQGLAPPPPGLVVWPRIAFQAYTNMKMAPDTACLGRNFLRHGILVWENGITYFLFLTPRQEAFASEWDRLNPLSERFLRIDPNQR